MLFKLQQFPRDPMSVRVHGAFQFGKLCEKDLLRQPNPDSSMFMNRKQERIPIAMKLRVGSLVWHSIARAITLSWILSRLDSPRFGFVTTTFPLIDQSRTESDEF